MQTRLCIRCCFVHLPALSLDRLPSRRLRPIGFRAGAHNPHLWTSGPRSLLQEIDGGLKTSTKEPITRPPFVGLRGPARCEGCFSKGLKGKRPPNSDCSNLLKMEASLCRGQLWHGSARAPRDGVRIRRKGCRSPPPPPPTPNPWPIRGPCTLNPHKPQTLNKP